MGWTLVGQTSPDPPEAEREVASVPPVGAVDERAPAAFNNVTGHDDQPDEGQAQSQHQPREPIWAIDPTLLKTKAAALPVPEELFDPHAPSVEAHRLEACVETGDQTPRGVFAFGPVVDQVDRTEVTGLRDADVLNVAPLALGRIQGAALLPTRAPGTSHMGVRVQAHAEVPPPVARRAKQVHAVELAIACKHDAGPFRHDLGQILSEAALRRCAGYPGSAVNTPLDRQCAAQAQKVLRTGQRR